MRSGDVFDISQTVNGISRFMFLNGDWYYFHPQLKLISLNERYKLGLLRCDVSDLLNVITDEEKNKYLGNIYHDKIENSPDYVKSLIRDKRIGIILGDKPDTKMYKNIIKK